MEAKLGSETAELLMRSVPPPDDEFATRRDLSDAVHVLRGDLQAAVTQLRGEMAEMRVGQNDLHTQLERLGERMDAGFVSVRGEVAADVGKLRPQLWLSSFSAAATAGALVLASVALT